MSSARSSSSSRYVWDTWAADEGSETEGFSTHPSYDQDQPDTARTGLSSLTSNRVWDHYANLDDETVGHLTQDQHDDMTIQTYFSRDIASVTMKSPKKSLAKQTSSSSSSSSASVSNASLQSSVNELKQRVAGMQEQLRSLTAESKDLHSEMQRLKNAREKRTQRLKVTWQSKLDAQINEQRKTLEQQSLFLEKVVGDKKAMLTKKTTLLEQLTKKRADRSDSLQLISNQGTKRLNQARRQWEADEKIHFNKIGSQRAEGLQNSIAETFTSKLEKIVAEGKDAASQKEAKLDLHLQQLKSQLELESQTKLTQALSNVRAGLRSDEDRLKHRVESRQMDIQRKYNDSLNMLKERFQREERQLVETAEKDRKNESDASMDSLRRMREIEERQTSELLAHQHEVYNETSERLKHEIIAAQEKQANDLNEHRRNMNVSTNVRQQKLLTSKKDDIQTEIEAEMASILSKVRADIETDAGAERKKRSKQLECIREDIQGDIERICLNEDNSMSKLAALNGEVESLRVKNATLRDRKQVQREELDESKDRVAALRTELKSVEATLHSEKDNHERAYDKRRKVLMDQTSVWEGRILDAQVLLQETKTKLREEREQARAGCDEEKSRINEKITIVLSKKNFIATELKKQMGELKRRNARLQEDIDSSREAKLEAGEILRV